MKIYCLLLDALPWSPGLAAIAEKEGLDRLHQFSAGAFTTTTLLSMFTGKLPSDLVPGGVGYLSHNEDRYYAWMKNNSTNLLDLLGQAGFEVRLHHHLDYLLRMLLGYRSQDPLAEFHDDLSGRWSHVRLSSPCLDSDDDAPTLDNFEHYGNEEKCEQFYEAEKRFIQRLQASTTEQNIFFLTQQQDWHDSWYTNDRAALKGARRRTEAWLKLWDFSEQDAIFWVFSDHGYQVESDLNPKDVLTWVLYKDNTHQPLPASNRFISSCDFYSTVLRKIGKSYGSFHSIPIDDRRPDDDQLSDWNKNYRSRIYCVEDARVKDSPDRMCTAGVAIIDEWVVDDSSQSEATRLLPFSMTMVTFLQQKEELFVYRYDFFHENPYSFQICPVDSLKHQGYFTSLMQALQCRFSWLDRSKLLAAMEFAGIPCDFCVPATSNPPMSLMDEPDTIPSEGTPARFPGLPSLILLPSGMVVPSLPAGVASEGS